MKSARMATNAKRLTLKAIVILSLSIFGFTFFVGFAGAQVITNPQGLAVNVEVKGSDVREGDIISVTKEGYVKATQPYDSLIFGVVVSAPILSVKEKSDSTKPVVSSGEAYVLVSTSNGEIKEGDLITSSTTAGVGQKATSVGYTVGKALSEYKDSSKAGLIPVIVNIGYGGGSASGGGSLFSLIGIVANPENSRFVLGGIIGILVLISVTIAFIRLISSGITAIGRNPLARATIIRGMVIAAFVIAILAIAGVGAIIAIINSGR